MRSVTNLPTQERAGQMPQVSPPFQKRRHGGPLLSLDWLDTFVLHYSELGFREFFSRLQSLEQWHELLANFDALQERRMISHERHEQSQSGSVSERDNQQERS